MWTLAGKTARSVATLHRLAARRVTQTSMALGRGITSDLIPRGTVTRVIGTEDRSDSAEGAYFQALAQRSAHIAQIASVDGQQAEPVLGAEADAARRLQLRQIIPARISLGIEDVRIAGIRRAEVNEFIQIVLAARKAQDRPNH